MVSGMGNIWQGWSVLRSWCSSIIMGLNNAKTLPLLPLPATAIPAAAPTSAAVPAATPTSATVPAATPASTAVPATAVGSLKGRPICELGPGMHGR